MKKIGILNQDISTVVAGMGHLDMLTVADAGLPIPAGPIRIDLALKGGLPGFLETVEVLAAELQVEVVIIAEEMAQVSPQIETGLRRLFPEAHWQTLTHTEFKRLTRDTKAVIRTGEFTPYANVILVSGVVF